MTQAKDLARLPLDGVAQYGSMRQFLGNHEAKPGMGQAVVLVVQGEMPAAQNPPRGKNIRKLRQLQQSMLPPETEILNRFGIAQAEIQTARR